MLKLDLILQIKEKKIKKVIGLMKDELGGKNKDRVCRIKTKTIHLLNRLHQ